MKIKQYFKQRNQRNEQRWTGISKRSAKGKRGNKGIHARNGQIENVWIEAIFNHPCWVKTAHK